MKVKEEEGERLLTLAVAMREEDVDIVFHARMEDDLPASPPAHYSMEVDILCKNERVAQVVSRTFATTKMIARCGDKDGFPHLTYTQTLGDVVGAESSFNERLADFKVTIYSIAV